jgi:hypothetical protein
VSHVVGNKAGQLPTIPGTSQFLQYLIDTEIWQMMDGRS